MKKIFAVMVALMVAVGLMLTVPAFATNNEAEPCVPKDAYTETTGWVTESPGEGWYEIDERVIEGTDPVPAVLEYEYTRQVLVSPATEDVYDVVWHVWTGGPVAEGVVPSVNDPAWNATGANPGGQHANRPVGVPYFVSHGGSGNGDWFLYKNALVTPGKPAVYETKVYWFKDTPGPDWTPTGESRVVTEAVPGTPDVTEYKFAFDHEAVECENPGNPPTDTPTDEPTDEPTDTPTDEPTEVPTDAPTVTPEPTDEPTTPVTDNPEPPVDNETPDEPRSIPNEPKNGQPDQPQTPKEDEPQVPTAVNAGL